MDQVLKEQRIVREKTAMPMLWLGMVGMAMVFIGFASAVIIRQSEPDWVSFKLPMPFVYSTLVIVASSVTMWLAQAAAKKNDFKKTTTFVGLTLLLGLAFVVSQFLAYSYMVENNMTVVGANVSISFLYVITFVHLLHLVGGNIALLVTYINSKRNKYNKENTLGLRLCATFWHFLGALWLCILLFLSIIH